MPQPDSASAQEQRRDLCLRVKELRDAAGLTQQDFAAELSRSRSASEQRRTFTRNKINRVENGHAAVDLVLAHALDEYALTRDLPSFGFVSRVSGAATAELDNARGRELRHLLGTRTLDEIQIVMCDLTDYAFYLSLAPLVPSLKVTVLVPTAERVQALFGTRREESGPASGAYGEYGERLNEHLWRQIRLLHRIAAGRDGLTLDVLQSHAVLNPMVVARHGRHASCIYWPPVPVEGSQPEPDVVPAIGDADIASWYEKQIALRTAESRDSGSFATRPLHLGDMFLMSEPLPPSEPVCRIGSRRFLEFLPRAVARREIDAERAVAAFALLMPYVRSVSEGAPSTELLFRSRTADSQDADRVPRQRLSFLSAWVTASAAWQGLDEALAGESEPPALLPSTGTPSLQTVVSGMARSEQHLVEQSRAFMARLLKHQPTSDTDTDEDRFAATVLDHACRIALCDELELVYGLDRSVAAPRLQDTRIADLRVRKDAGADLLARIYCLELHPDERDRITGRAGRYRPGSLVRLTMREVRSMMHDVNASHSEHEFSDCLGLALSHDLVRPGFSGLLDALHASDSSASSSSAVIHENPDRDHRW